MSLIANIRNLVALLSCTSVLSQIIHGPNYNHPDGGPPAEFFTAAPTMPVAALESAAAQLSSVSADGRFLMNSDSSTKSPIYEDWASLEEGAAVVWTADMDVDCDGINSQCRGNPDGLNLTSWGALSAYAVPYIVIPGDYLEAHEETFSGNNVAAVICNGKMFYGILGDSNGDEPQVTGEASWLMARTCFPDDKLGGNVGHRQSDVTYILFLGDDAVLPHDAISQHYITDFGRLRSMGDRLVNALVSNTGISSDNAPPTVPTSAATRNTPFWVQITLAWTWATSGIAQTAYSLTWATSVLVQGTSAPASAL
ncbi:glycoside hydrolase family 75 protein [Aspergillus undulatus]|uniref:glycoside hydrolase family 75 protein n=1 Tax=Aspergillus undulatus TaxID=1810928 RepID=UPI003CCDF2AC